MKLLLGTLNSKFIHSSLGIYSVAAYFNTIKQKNHKLELREYTTQTPLLSILADMQPLEPEVIALAVYIWNKEETLRLTKVLRQALPNCVLVLGGPEVSFNAAQVLTDNPEIDYIVQGEGDMVFVELVEYLASEHALPLPACVSKQGQIQTEVCAVNDLDTLPFVYSSLELDLSNKIIYYESSRGCPYACSYCLSGISRQVRYKSYANVVQELGYLIAQGVKQVKFVDRTYNLDDRHYLPIMRFLASQDTDTNFHFEIKADLLTEEVLDFLQTVPVGRFQFEIGIQTTHAPTLRAINRVDNWHKIQHNVQRLLSFGNIHIHVDLIAGLPYEDLTTFKGSFNAVHNLWADMLQLGFLKILHGSSISEQIQEHNYRYMPVVPYEVLSNKYISYAELRQLKLIEDLVDKYYNSGKYQHTLRFITARYADDAFAFYEQFTQYLESKNMHLQSLSSRTHMQLLREFIAQSAKLAAQQNELDELLYFDSFISGEKWCAEFFATKLDVPANKELLENFWRNDSLVAKYVPDYKFMSWSQVRKRYRMEEFVLNAERCLYMVDATQDRLIRVNGEDFYGAVQ